LLPGTNFNSTFISMKNKFLTLLAGAALFLNLSSGYAATTGDAAAELKTLVAQIRTKLETGKKTEADFAPELKQFDTLLAEHKGEKTDDVAQILYMKATLYLQVLENNDKGVALIKQLKNDFPDTKLGKNADDMLAMIAKQGEAKKIQSALAVGSKLPDFDEKDLAGNPLSIAGHKGKVVMIDFWATWCGPCRAELPNVIATYQKHHGEGFDIIGVSLDEDRDKLDSFLKKQDMAWPQFFDGKGWSNKLAVKYGIESIPATFLLDGNGTIIGKDLRGEALEAAVAKAVAKK
jgi:thiol-disulfide isomerase/thioredoxin